MPATASLAQCEDKLNSGFGLYFVPLSVDTAVAANLVGSAQSQLPAKTSFRPWVEPLGGRALVPAMRGTRDRRGPSASQGIENAAGRSVARAARSSTAARRLRGTRPVMRAGLCVDRIKPRLLAAAGCRLDID